MVESGIAVINGQVNTLDKSFVSVCDRGYLFGHALFETILILETGIVSWNDHVSRLAKGCEKLLIKLPDFSTLLDWVRLGVSDLKKQWGGRPEDIRIQARITVSGGTNSSLSIPRTANSSLVEPNVTIILKFVPVQLVSLSQSGIRLYIVPDARNVGLIDVKSTNYLWNLLSLEQAKSKGFDDAVFCSVDGTLTECTTANFIWINSDGHVCSVPNKENCLPGTTQKTLFRALKKSDHELVELGLNRRELHNAIMCYAVSSVRGLVPVSALNSTQFDIHAQSELTEYLNDALRKEQLLNMT
jgi:branched-subunit amino acid aminotransferase/4-amino-4-deoxychorismate lyase